MFNFDPGGIELDSVSISRIRSHQKLASRPACRRITNYLEVSDTLEKSPVVLTCDVSVLQDLRRTNAVLGGL
jgi:hypothetical protein